jgi:transcriptional enhancer factor
MAVQYPDVEHQRKKDRRGAKGADGNRRPDLERSGSKRKRTEDDGDAASWARREPTGSDLICKVAMYQELWSCAPDSNRWTRQSIIFWRFNTTNQWYKYGAVFRPAGTSWRWLTVNDPMSRYHQQKALIYPSVGVGRDAVMSPTPTIGQHMTANMNETFGAWDNGASMTQHVPALPSSTAGMGGLFDSFSGGLATPPPTAGLHSSYPTGSFDGSVSGHSTAGGAGNGSNNSAGVSFLSSNGTGEAPQPSGLSHATGAYFDTSSVASSYPETKPMPSAMVNPYIATSSALDLSGQQLVYDNSETVGNSGLQGWDMAALDSWSNNPNTATTGNNGGDGSAASSATQPGPASGWPGTSQHQPQQQAKMEPGVAPLWPGQWGPVPSAERDTSPRAMKRRRTDTTFEQGAAVPVSTGW